MMREMEEKARHHSIETYNKAALEEAGSLQDLEAQIQERCDVCTDITVVTQAWGYENSWTFGSCSSSQTYGSYQEYTEECCQPAGSYDLTCTCSYGDGWHGGYIQIGDSFHYCADFTGGYDSIVEDIAYGEGNETPPQETVCADITVVTQAWGYENSWTFGSCSSSQTYGSYQEYTEECCQPAGSYDLTCTCSYGDGWHGGYIQIGNDIYCDDFTAGYENVVDDIAQ